MDSDGERQVGFIQGKVMPAPLSTHIIPALEWGVSVFAVEMAVLVLRELDVI